MEACYEIPLPYNQKAYNMKKVTLLVATAVLAFSCNTKKTVDPNPGNNNNNNSSSSSLIDVLDINDADGIFVAVRTVSSQETPLGPIEIIIGTAVAAEGDLQNGSFNDIGAVKCAPEANATFADLTKQDNNSYVFMPSATEPMGINYTTSGIPEWEAPAASVSHSSNYVFPEYPAITSGTTIDKSQSYEFSVDGYSGAHEVLFSISSTNNTNVYKIIKSGDPEFAAKKVTFTASELSVLENSDQAIIQVAPYTIHTASVSGKKYYFLNETVVSKVATIQ